MSTVLSEEEIKERFYNTLKTYEAGVQNYDSGYLDVAKGEFQNLVQGYNHAPSQYMLAVMYKRMRIQNVNPNDILFFTVDYLKKSAEQEYASAQFALGEMYQKGNEIITKDLKTATNLFRKAAKQGHSKAQFNFAMMYIQGDVLPESLIHAYIWFSVAKLNGYDAKAVDAELAKIKLSGSDLIRAKERTADFWETIHDLHVIDHDKS